ncbi:uncharacterized protein N7479_008742 [Penicillium vulpinum]|uniref:Aminoglycoside phosphotransferase domain-containing protein n=1 Tax=Penicillium vulpinum TaxID=29845 RepID=A0A1V6S0Y9_9EURO|nr:uncharacterized protein N7479_008742 [Penicillium vulpinum]KAJ5950329.1 hypothetical protein N7479_008742 [Penicillium vulpinum]OQE07697.1 hypothetical protein PENVUL_c012G04911 [Penicillium vulpinum]
MELCKTLYLNDLPINVTEAERLDPGRTVFRLTLSSPLYYNLLSTSTVIVKQQRIGWEDEFQQEIQAYKKLENLQGTIIPIFFGQGSFNGLDALVISEVEGITPHNLARGNFGVQQEALKIHLEKALGAFDEHKAIYWDAKPDNFLFCADAIPEQSKVMVVDLEQVEFPRPLQPWHHNINSGSVRNLISKFKDGQKPNRPLSPASACYQPGAKGEEGRSETIALQRPVGRIKDEPPKSWFLC